MEALRVREKGEIVKAGTPSELTMNIRKDFFALQLRSPDGKLGVDEIHEFIKSRLLPRFDEISLRLESHLGVAYSICRKEAESLLGKINLRVEYDDDQADQDYSYSIPLGNINDDVTDFLNKLINEPVPTGESLQSSTVRALTAKKEMLENDMYGSPAVLDRNAKNASLIMRVLRLNQHYNEVSDKRTDESLLDTLDLFRNETLIKIVLHAGELDRISGQRIDSRLVAGRLNQLCALSDLAIKSIYSTSYEEISSCVIDIRTSLEKTSGISLCNDSSEDHARLRAAAN